MGIFSFLFEKKNNIKKEEFEEIKRQEEIELQKKQEEIRKQKELEEQKKQEEIRKQKELEEQKKQEEIRKQKELEERQRIQETREQNEIQRQYEINEKYGTTIQELIKVNKKLKKLKMEESNTCKNNENLYNKLYNSNYNERAKIKFEYVPYIDSDSDSYILSVDLHGLSLSEAKSYYPKFIKLCSRYHVELTVIHGYNNGTTLRDYIRSFSDESIVKMDTDIYNFGITKLKIYNKNCIRERQLKETKEIERNNKILELETELHSLVEKLRKGRITKNDIKKYIANMKT